MTKVETNQSHSLQIPTLTRWPSTKLDVNSPRNLRGRIGHCFWQGYTNPSAWLVFADHIPQWLPAGSATEYICGNGPSSELWCPDSGDFDALPRLLGKRSLGSPGSPGRIRRPGMDRLLDHHDG